MGKYSKIVNSIREAAKKKSKPKFVVRPMSPEDRERGEKIRKGQLMSDEEYEAKGGDRPDLEKK